MKIKSSFVVTPVEEKMTIPLETCPLCEGDGSYHKPNPGEYYVRCDECEMSTFVYSSPGEAAAAWNKRPREQKMKSLAQKSASHRLDDIIKMQALISEREGMISENSMRAATGMAPAYGEDAFFVNARQMRELIEDPSDARSQEQCLSAGGNG